MVFISYPICSKTKIMFILWICCLSRKQTSRSSLGVNSTGLKAPPVKYATVSGVNSCLITSKQSFETYIFIKNIHFNLSFLYKY